MAHRYLLACVLALSCPNIHAQDSAAKTLDGAHILSQQGRYEQLIDTLTPFLNSSAMDTAQRSKALTLVAVAYQASGNFSESQRTLDKALSLLRNHPQYVSDYADVLANLSILYRDIGDVDAVKRTAEKARRLYQQVNSHAGLVAIDVVLGENSLNQRKPAEAARYLAQAQQESAQVNELGDDYRIAITDLQAAIALLEGHPTLAQAGYRQSLDLRIQFNGKQHPGTGWGYMLLGKADLRAGDIQSALANMRQGLAILAEANGSGRVAYLYSEVAYSEALAADGQRSQAKQVKADAMQALSTLFRDQCTSCQINVAAFR